MNKISKKILIVAVAVVLMAMTAMAGGKWIKLGDRVVSDKLDHDSISVSASKGQFTALKLKVLKRPVQFRKMKVHFANGSVQDVKLKSVIKAGHETRVIDLVGDDRVIKRVEFWYDAQTRGRGKKAKIRLFGRR